MFARVGLLLERRFNRDVVRNRLPPNVIDGKKEGREYTRNRVHHGLCFFSDRDYSVEIRKSTLYVTHTATGRPF